MSYSLISVNGGRQLYPLHIGLQYDSFDSDSHLQQLIDSSCQVKSFISYMIPYQPVMLW